MVRKEMQGDPEAMRRFAERLVGISETVVEPPGKPSCEGGMQACGTFAAADAVATLALTRFLSETGESLAALKEAAAVAAEDYQATDLAGALAVASGVLDIDVED
jgi:hypothetical protein